MSDLTINFPTIFKSLLWLVKLSENDFKKRAWVLCNFFSTKHGELLSERLRQANPFKATGGVLTHSNLNSRLLVFLMLQNEVPLVLNDNLIIFKLGDAAIYVGTAVTDDTTVGLLLREVCTCCPTCNRSFRYGL